MKRYTVVSTKGNELHDRLAQCAGNHTFRRLGELTQTHPETVRRYMQGQAPSAEFLAALSTALDLNPAWLLTGQGPMQREHVKTAALAEAEVPELLTALSNTLTALIERVERLETYVQTLETRVRGKLPDLEATLNESQPERQDGSTAASNSIADNIASTITRSGTQRSREDDD